MHTDTLLATSASEKNKQKVRQEKSKGFVIIVMNTLDNYQKVITNRK